MNGMMKELLDAAGRGCMGWGGFMVDAEGRLIEEYDEREEEPEGTDCGLKLEDDKEAGGADHVRRAAERGGA